MIDCGCNIQLTMDDGDVYNLNASGVHSVNGKVGRVEITAGDIPYDDSVEYRPGSVGDAIQSKSEITVDSALSNTSENPVQNKVIAETVVDLENDVTDLKEDFNQLPTEETGQELLSEEELNTVYQGVFLDTLDRIFTNLPQDETMAELVLELEAENAWLDQLYREVAVSMA